MAKADNNRITCYSLKDHPFKILQGSRRCDVLEQALRLSPSWLDSVHLRNTHPILHPPLSIPNIVHISSDMKLFVVVVAKRYYYYLWKIWKSQTLANYIAKIFARSLAEPVNLESTLSATFLKYFSGLLIY